MVGALVLVALAVIFLPMLFSRQDEQRQVTSRRRPRRSRGLPQVQVEPVAVPEPQALPQEPVPSDDEGLQRRPPIAPVHRHRWLPSHRQTGCAASAKPLTGACPADRCACGKPDTTQSRVDANGLPVSWSVQLASLSSRASAESLQKTLRSQGYNAYIRSADGKNRVFVGPLIERAEADRLRDLLSRQQNLKGFVVRFQPERG
jgi:DedD protein